MIGMDKNLIEMTLCADYPVDRPRILHLLIPHARVTMLHLLSRLHAFIAFVSGLDKAISQPETRFMPMGTSRDPRATMLAKDRMASAAQKEGVDLELWGRAVQKIHAGEGSSPPLLATMLIRHTASLEHSDDPPLDLLMLRPNDVPELVRSTLSALPSPSSLFVCESDAETYDAITFQVIPPDAGLECNRCGWRTISLFGSPSASPTGEETSAWSRWRMERERGCGCGGNWSRSA